MVCLCSRDASRTRPHAAATCCTVVLLSVFKLILVREAVCTLEMVYPNSYCNLPLCCPVSLCTLIPDISYLYTCSHGGAEARAAGARGARRRLRPARDHNGPAARRRTPPRAPRVRPLEDRYPPARAARILSTVIHHIACLMRHVGCCTIAHLNTGI